MQWPRANAGWGECRHTFFARKMVNFIHCPCIYAITVGWTNMCVRLLFVSEEAADGWGGSVKERLRRSSTQGPPPRPCPSPAAAAAAGCRPRRVRHCLAPRPLPYPIYHPLRIVTPYTTPDNLSPDTALRVAVRTARHPLASHRAETPIPSTEPVCRAGRPRRRPQAQPQNRWGDGPPTHLHTAAAVCVLNGTLTGSFVLPSHRRSKAKSSPAGSSVSSGNVSANADSVSSHGSSSDAAARDSAIGSLNVVCWTR